MKTRTPKEVTVYLSRLEKKLVQLKKEYDAIDTDTNQDSTRRVYEKKINIIEGKIKSLKWFIK